MSTQVSSSLSLSMTGAGSLLACAAPPAAGIADAVEERSRSYILSDSGSISSLSKVHLCYHAPHSQRVTYHRISEKAFLADETHRTTPIEAMSTGPSGHIANKDVAPMRDLHFHLEIALRLVQNLNKRAIDQANGRVRELLRQELCKCPLLNWILKGAEAFDRISAVCPPGTHRFTLQTPCIDVRMYPHARKRTLYMQEITAMNATNCQKNVYLTTRACASRPSGMAKLLEYAEWASASHKPVSNMGSFRPGSCLSTRFRSQSKFVLWVLIVSVAVPPPLHTGQFGLGSSGSLTLRSFLTFFPIGSLLHLVVNLQSSILLINASVA